MSIYEYDEELHKKTLFEEGFEAGEERGRKIGEEYGKKQGIYEAKIANCRNMLRKHMSVELIAEVTEMTPEEVKRIAEEEILVRQ